MSGRGVRRTAVGAVLLVGLVAAVVSYAHIYELAARSGEGWRAALIPLSVDGMLVAATLAIVDRRRLRDPAGWVPWLGLGLGIAASLAGNVAAARPDVVSQVLAAWPPVALAVSIETLVVILRRSRVPAEPVATQDASPPAELVQEAPGGDPWDVGTVDEHGLSRLWETAPDQQPDRSDRSGPVRWSEWPEWSEHRSEHRSEHPVPVLGGPLGPAPDLGEFESDQGTGDEWLPAVQDLADGLGRRPTRQAVRDLTGVGATRADRLRNSVRTATDQPDRSGPVRINGAVYRSLGVS